MFYFADLVLCALACLIQTTLGQRGCNQISYGSSSNNCGSYGGVGTGQVGVSGDIGACGSTCVAGSVPVLGSVGFGGYAPVCGSVSISGQCDCDSQEETLIASTASTADLFGRGTAVAAVRNRDQTIGLGQCNCAQTALSGQCKSLCTPRGSLRTPSNIARSAPSLSLSTPSCTVNAPSIVSAPSKRLSAPRISPVSPISESAPSRGSYGGTGTGQVGVSGNINASGDTVVIGSVPVRGAVDFSGYTPTSGTVYISARCKCDCD